MQLLHSEELFYQSSFR